MDEIDESDAVSALYRAGRHIGLSHVELVGNGNGGTIWSGLAAGRRDVAA